MYNSICKRKKNVFQILPRIAEFKEAQTDSLWEGLSCHPTGLAQGFEYANKLNAS